MIDLSVIIVTHNARGPLSLTLESLAQARGGLELEVLLVDNASTDSTVEMVRERFPWVEVIEAGGNLGFAKANNIALRRARGRYLMLLNPDTVLGERSLEVLVDFLEQHLEVGACGPKVLNRDGTFQATSKRGLVTPWAGFCKLFGLSRLFPRSRLFNRYELGFLDVDKVHQVEGLYGAAMMVRREVYEQVGGLDESYFMYGEDLDWSHAIQRAGWKLCYVPQAPILHFKGESTRNSSVDRDAHFFEAMEIFSRKWLRLSSFERFVVDGGIVAARGMSRFRRARLNTQLGVLFALGGALAYLFKRSRTLLQLLAAGMLAAGGRLAWLDTRSTTATGKPRRTLILGPDPRGVAAYEEILRGTLAGFRPVGWLSFNEKLLGLPVMGMPVVALAEDLARAALDYRAEVVLLSPIAAPYGELVRLLERRPLPGVDVRWIAGASAPGEPVSVV